MRYVVGDSGKGRVYIYIQDHERLYLNAGENRFRDWPNPQIETYKYFNSYREAVAGLKKVVPKAHKLPSKVWIRWAEWHLMHFEGPSVL